MPSTNEVELNEMLKERKRLDPDAPDMIALGTSMGNEVVERCERCALEIAQESDGELWVHLTSGSVYCPNDNTGCSIATPRGPSVTASPPSESIAGAESVPLCPVHEHLDKAGKLEMTIGGLNCVACSLQERVELLALITPFAGSKDSVTVLREVADFYNTHYAEGRIVVSYPAPALPVTVSDNHHEKLKILMARRAVELHKEPGGFVSQLAVVAAQYVREQLYAAASPPPSSVQERARRAAEKISSIATHQIGIEAESEWFAKAESIIAAEIAAEFATTQAEVPQGWQCACGWRGSSAEFKANASGGYCCPSCGASGGLILTPRSTVPTTAPLTPEQAKERASKIILMVIGSPIIREVAIFSQPEEMEKLTDGVATELMSVAGTAWRSMESDDMVDEVTRRMDAVVDAAVEWRQGGADNWEAEADSLETTVDSLLELRSPPLPKNDLDHKE